MWRLQTEADRREKQETIPETRAASVRAAWVSFCDYRQKPGASFGQAAKKNFRRQDAVDKGERA